MIGIIRDKWGYRAYVKVGKLQREKRYKPDTSLKTMQAWRDECRVALRKLRPEAGAAGTLRGDVTRYLEQVRAMPTYAERSRHLDLWITALGATTPRARIASADIRTILHRWRHDGLEPATCNKRRSALMHLWTVLDGKGASNPVRDVPKFPPPPSLPLGRDPHGLDAKLKLAPLCRSRASARVLLWTGMRPCELQRAEPSDLNLRGATVIVRTAKGGRVRMVPLTSQAIQAWKEFVSEDAWHHVPQSSPLGRWLKKIIGQPIRVYDLRHSYGTALALRGTRLDVIASLMGHSTLELTKRYTLAAVTPDAASATLRLAKTASLTASRNGRKVAVSVGQRRTAS
jgi:integrase/recombinase XerC